MHILILSFLNHVLNELQIGLIFQFLGLLAQVSFIFYQTAHRGLECLVITFCGR